MPRSLISHRTLILPIKELLAMPCSIRAIVGRAALSLTALVLTWGAPSLVPVVSADETAPKFAPTEDYAIESLHGWPVRVQREFARQQPKLYEQALAHLRHQLYQIEHRLPQPAIDRLKQVTIWLEENEPHHPCAVYHPDAGWLRDHDMNPDKARCVEISNVKNFLSWTTDQPWMVLHEMAHAYHDQFLEGGHGNAQVAEVFQAALAGEKYSAVQRLNGKVEKAYAASNPMEYFAESTEAFFGTNDFYPYVRSELREYDPRMYELLDKLWGTNN